jgi:hypothetical protein
MARPGRRSLRYSAENRNRTAGDFENLRSAAATSAAWAALRGCSARLFLVPTNMSKKLFTPSHSKRAYELRAIGESYKSCSVENYQVADALEAQKIATDANSPIPSTVELDAAGGAGAQADGQPNQDDVQSVTSNTIFPTRSWKSGGAGLALAAV